MAFEQVHDREREEGRDERGALLEHVSAIDDGREDRRVRRRAADAAILERLDERRLRVPRRRARRVALGLEREEGDLLPVGQLRKASLLVVLGGLVPARLVGGEKAAEGEHGAGGARTRRPRRRDERGADPERNRLAACVLHLRRERPLPDQVVERVLVAGQLALQLVRRPERVTGRTDRLVGLLGVRDRSSVRARLLGHVVAAEELAHLRRERRRAPTRRASSSRFACT